MRNYFVFLPDSGGMVDSRELSIHIEHMPDIQRAPERVEKVIIPGRSGTLTKTQGKDIYDSYTKSFDIVALDEEKIQSIHRLLRGNGKIIFSNEPQFRYTVSITDGWSFNRFFRQWRRATLSMDTFPFKEKSEEKIWHGYNAESGKWQVDLNIESDVACPFFAEITYPSENNTLTFKVNNKTCLFGIVPSKKIFIDNEKALAYSEYGSDQFKWLFPRDGGEFPMRLNPRENVITVIGHPSEITVKCRGWFL